MKVADINQLKISALLPSPKGVALALLEACRREDTVRRAYGENMTRTCGSNL